MHWTVAMLAMMLTATTTWADELSTTHVLSTKGDGPDGKANSADDAWQFWFELAHAPGKFERLSLHSASLSAAQRKSGIPKKVRGPIAALLPNPDDSDGWIFHRDWDGRFEGVWADRKTSAVLAHPYVEKKAHCAVAVTYRIAEAGRYKVAVKLTDLSIDPAPPHDGILWRLERVSKTGDGKVLDKGGPIGDGQGRPDSTTGQVENIELAEGDLVRLVIHPNRWWGSDLTRIDRFGIEKIPR